MSDSIPRDQRASDTVQPLVRLTDHEKRILNCMKIGEDYFSSHFVRMGIKCGVKRQTMQKLRRLGFIRHFGMPCQGHEHDWRETGHYYSLWRKIKEHEEWTYTI